jgi:hypothetical protein
MDAEWLRLHEPIWADGDIPDVYCPTCNGTRVITRPDPTAHNHFPKPDRTIRCPDCTDRTT